MAQAVRIPILVALLVAIDLLRGPIEAATAAMRPGAAFPRWLALLALAVLFVLVVLLRRDRDASRVLLIVEALIAGVIAVVPWLLDGPTWGSPEALLLISMRSTVGMGFVSALALAWAVVTIRRLGQTLRRTS